MTLLAINLDHKERLSGVCYLEIIGLEEVLSDAHLLAILGREPHHDWVLGEIDVLNEVSLLEAVSCDHSLELELVKDPAFLVSPVLS